MYSDSDEIPNPEIFKNVELLINEGGSGRIINTNLIFEVELTQKIPTNFTVTKGSSSGGNNPTVVFKPLR